MIAVAKPSARHNALPTYEDLLPAIEQQAAAAFRTLPPAECEELIAEVVANAFCAYQRLVERGMANIAYATPLARYAIRQIRSGRRVGSKLNVRDTSSRYCQRANGFRVERLDVRDEIQGGWKEVVVEDKTAGPAEIAATRIDFAAWLKSLKPRTRRIAKTLAIGEPTASVSRKFGISQGRVSQLRRELQQAWLTFHGESAVV
jgi:hypothetical protein